MSYKIYSELNDEEKQKIIRELYVEKNLSLSIIAEKLGTYANKIRRDATKYNIKLKNKSEAQKNALKSGRHKHPTKGMERNDETKSKIGLSVLKSWENLTDQEKNTRQEKARDNWNKMSQDEKENMLRSANKAVRISSKIGSKLEKYLFENLIRDGYTTEFHKEQILSNTKLQIDLFMPTLNIAIEVDGPSHFKEVWGTDSLNRNINYDNKKTGLILGKGLVLIRIRQNMDYSKARAKLIYNKLVSVVKDIEKKFPSAGQREIKLEDNNL